MAGRERERERGGAGDAAAKAQAAREVCAASAAFASCAHRRRRSPRRPHFVDWYLVLAVGEAASEDAVRRRYRQLALQLHPDKNRHPKAECAFKIVSEAHACLTDRARRRAFDVERRASFCAACHDRHVRSLSTPSPSSLAPTAAGARHRATAAADKRAASACGATSEQEAVAGARRPPAQALRDVQNWLRDECLRGRQSFPVFDPAEHRYRFPDYPHARPPPSFGDVKFWRFFNHVAGADQNQNPTGCRSRGGGSRESPVYQIRTAPAESTAGTKRPW